MKTCPHKIVFLTILSGLLLGHLACQKDQLPPSGKIEGIDPLQAVRQGTQLVIRVHASDSDGSVSGISLYLDGNLIRTAESSPLVYPWNTINMEPGKYRFEAFVYDDEGNVGRDALTATIIENPDLTGPPRPAFNALHNVLLTGTTACFYDLSKRDPVSWKWDFGDGNSSNLKNPVHIYEAPGTYTVSLTVANAHGSEILEENGFMRIVEKTGSLAVDYDGNVYKTVPIGEQLWMAENLKTTHCSSGHPLMDGTNAGNLGYDTLSQYYFSYNHQDSTISAYGRLYTWKAAMDGEPSTNANPSGVCGICPKGWHIPSDNEWMQLEMFLGMSPEEVLENKVRGSNEGGKLKEKGISHWIDPNVDATDEYGFSAVPGGERFWSGVFRDKGKRGTYWSSTLFQHNAAWQRWFYHEHGMISRADFNRISVGASVRCVKD